MPFLRNSIILQTVSAINIAPTEITISNHLDWLNTPRLSDKKADKKTCEERLK